MRIIAMLTAEIHRVKIRHNLEEGLSRLGPTILELLFRSYASCLLMGNVDQ